MLVAGARNDDKLARRGKRWIIIFDVYVLFTRASTWHKFICVLGTYVVAQRERVFKWALYYVVRRDDLLHKKFAFRWYP